jgi:segregation and condensation protein B
MLKNIIEALLFAAGKGISYKEIKDYFNDEFTEKEIKNAILEIRAEYSGDKGIILIEFNNKFQFQSNPKFGEKLANILQPIKEKELSKTLLQTLSIIAYKQPITRLEIEEIRDGVSCDYAISVLLRLNLIEITSRRLTSPGRPALFSTTDDFLKKFSLKCIEDLPDYDQLLTEVQNSDKYYKKTANLYRMEEENLSPEAMDKAEEDQYFDEITDDEPDFLKDEDIVVIE